MSNRHDDPPTQAADEASTREYLSSHRVFGVLPRSELRHLATQVVERTYPKGCFLRCQGEPSAHVFLVKRGLVALVEMDLRGNQRLMVPFSPGDVLGLAGTVFGLPSSPAAIAIVDTVALVLRKHVFDQLYRDFPELASPVTQEIFNILRRSQRTTTVLALTPMDSRVATFLLESKGRPPSEGEDCEIRISLTHQDMALLLGTTRETITRTLSRMSRAGLIAVSGHRVRILNADGLRRLVES